MIPRSHITTLVVVVVATVAACGGADSAPERAGTVTETEQPSERYRVVRVIDGDTVNIAYRGSTTVRPIGYDAPETYGVDECYGARATARATRLLDRDDARPGLQGVRVTLTFDPTQGRTGKYGRTLAYIGLPDGRDLGHVMIVGGYAREYTYDEPYRRQTAYQRAEQSARAHNAGLWGRCDEPAETTPTPTPTAVPAPPPDLDCDDMDGPVAIRDGDPHRLDSDEDGVGCE